MSYDGDLSHHWMPFTANRQFATGDIIAMSPPLIIEKSHIDQLVGTLQDVLNRLA